MKAWQGAKDRESRGTPSLPRSRAIHVLNSDLKPR